MNKTVLLVDDSPAIRRAVSLMLVAENVSTLEASDGNEALEHLKGNDVALVISDYHMPNLDGAGLLLKMREQAASKFTPVLVLTTDIDPEAISTLKRAGATGVLAKPIDPDSLRSAVRRCLA